LAAILVFWLHASGHAALPAPTVDVAGLSWTLSPGFGATGVSLFFVLSGFLLSQPFWRSLRGGPPVDLRSYLLRRLRRVYPAYAVAVLVLALVHDTRHSIPIRLAHVTSHLLMIHNLSEATIFSLSVPLWSIATEFQLYLVMPVLFAGMAMLARRGWRRPWLALGLALASGLLALLVLSVAPEAIRRVDPDPRLLRPDGAVVAHSLFAGLPDFCMGIAAGLVYQELHLRRRVTGARFPYHVELAAAAVAMGLVAFALAFHPMGFSMAARWPLLTLLYGGLVMTVSLSSAPFGIARWLDAWPIRKLGLMSYSFYLYHDLVLWNVLNRLAPRLGPSLAANRAFLVGSSFAITMVVAWLSYRCVESLFHGERGTGASPAMLSSGAVLT
jgi:peptidoglycan/LPS O-acetylase OafA/YrhL